MPSRTGSQERGSVQSVSSPRFQLRHIRQLLAGFWQRVLRILFRKENSQARQIDSPRGESPDFGNFDPGAVPPPNLEPAASGLSPDGYRPATTGENANSRDGIPLEQSVSRSTVADPPRLISSGELPAVQSSVPSGGENLRSISGVRPRDADTLVGQSAVRSEVTDSFESDRPKAKSEAVQAAVPIAFLLDRLDNLSRQVGILEESLRPASSVATATTEVTAARSRRFLVDSGEIRRADSASVSVGKIADRSIDLTDSEFQGSDPEHPRTNATRTQGFGPQDFDPLTERINERVLFDRGLTLE